MKGLYRPSPCLGLVPFCLHLDGAEFFTNSEFNVWSLQSVLASGDVWDTKFPICILPIECLRDDDIKSQTSEIIAQVIAWSMHYASRGLWPSTGPDGIELTGSYRLSRQGQELAGGYRGCYFGFRADGKARKETNLFQRSYLHSSICESCLAQRHHVNWIPLLSYKNFYPSAAHRLTRISPAPSCFTKNDITICCLEPEPELTVLLIHYPRPCRLHQQLSQPPFVSLASGGGMAPGHVLSRPNARVVPGNLQRSLRKCFGVLGSKPLPG